jgi:hypothetical protein
MIICRKLLNETDYVVFRSMITFREILSLWRDRLNVNVSVESAFLTETRDLVHQNGASLPFLCNTVWFFKNNFVKIRLELKVTWNNLEKINNIKCTIFCVVRHWSLVEVHRLFGETYRRLVHGRRLSQSKKSSCSRWPTERIAPRNPTLIWTRRDHYLLLFHSHRFENLTSNLNVFTEACVFLVTFLADYSTLKMAAVCSSETSVDLYQITMSYDLKIVPFVYVRSSAELHCVIFMTILICVTLRYSLL